MDVGATHASPLQIGIVAKRRTTGLHARNLRRDILLAEEGEGEAKPMAPMSHPTETRGPPSPAVGESLP